MGKFEFNIKNIALVSLIILLGSGIFLVVKNLNKEEKPIVQTQKITKIAEKTYSKTITLNTVISPVLTDISPKTPPTVTVKPSPTKSITPTTKIILSISPTGISTPSPTDVYVVLNRPIATSEANIQSQITPTPTRIAKLPKAGSLLFPSMFLLLAGFIVIVSLIF